MINDILKLRQLDFSSQKNPKYNYADQMSISQERVNLQSYNGLFHTLWI